MSLGCRHCVRTDSHHIPKYRTHPAFRTEPCMLYYTHTIIWSSCPRLLYCTMCTHIVRSRLPHIHRSSLALVSWSTKEYTLSIQCYTCQPSQIRKCPQSVHGYQVQHRPPPSVLPSIATFEAEGLESLTPGDCMDRAVRPGRVVLNNACSTLYSPCHHRRHLCGSCPGCLVLLAQMRRPRSVRSSRSPPRTAAPPLSPTAPPPPWSPRATAFRVRAHPPRRGRSCFRPGYT